VYFLKKWNLVTIPLISDQDGNMVDPINEILKEKIDIVKYQDKSQYKIIHKFTNFNNRTLTNNQ
jgi:transcription antitermination factor NusA-like protein